MKNSQSLQLVVSGDLRHTMTRLNVLPSVLGLDGALGFSASLVEGKDTMEIL